MFSDTYKIKLVDDVLYEVYGKVRIWYVRNSCMNYTKNGYVVKFHRSRRRMLNLVNVMCY